MSKQFLVIDGSFLEGGGQILRNALSFSCLLRRPIRIINIRIKRSSPGLAAQHLKCVHLLRDLTRAEVRGDFPGSTTLEFYPGKIKGGKFSSNIGTAGSVALLIQAALPVALFSNNKVELDLKGGTNAAMAPQVDFVTEIFRPNLEQFGGTFDFDLFKRGYYPKGGGHCKVVIYPVKKLKPCNITKFGDVKKVFGWSFVAGSLPTRLAYEMFESADQFIKANMEKVVPIEIESYQEEPKFTRENCSGIILGCETDAKCIMGSSGLWSKDESSVEIGKNAAMALVDCIKKSCCTDSYVQDQLIIIMALAEGTSIIKSNELTLHTKTAIYIAEKMSEAKFQVTEHDDGTCTIECNGIGYINKTMK